VSLFQHKDVGEFLAHRQTAAAKALRAIPEHEFLADIDGCVERIYELYVLDELSVSGRDSGAEVLGTDEARIEGYDAFGSERIIV
jgi:hypothetical protein